MAQSDYVLIFSTGFNAALENHNKITIPTTNFTKNRPRYIPANHGLYVNWSRKCSCIPWRHHCCRSIKTEFDRTDQESSDTHSRLWFLASTWKILVSCFDQKIYLQAIKYLGFLFDRYGHHLDPANVAAIQRIPPPWDCKQFMLIS